MLRRCKSSGAAGAESIWSDVCGGALNIIFPGSEYATNLIIANIKILSNDDSNSHGFSSDGREFGGRGPLAPLDPPLRLLLLADYT